MSTPIPARDAARAAALPQPRPPADHSVSDTGPGPAQVAQPSEPVGLFARHAWLIPAGAIASVVAVFVAMVLLTWLAGGGTPFDR